MLLLFIFFISALGLTQQQYDAIVADIRSILEPPAGDFVNEADFYGGAVRLPFHDAGSYNQTDGTGKPSGCINTQDPGNGGLSEVINGMEPVYQLHKTELSRADFWVLVGQVAIQDAGGPIIPFSWGRVDCNGNYPPAGNLPSAEKNWTEVYNVFVKRMGLSVQDITALLGAHTLGRTQGENSGYEFYWTATANRFSNQFYKDLIYGSWKRATRFFAYHGKTNQWTTDPAPDGADPFMMLNTDVALVYSIGEGSSGNCNQVPSSSCGYNSDTIDLVKLYASNQTRWFLDFTEGWTKLTSLGYPALKSLA